MLLEKPKALILNVPFLITLSERLAPSVKEQIVATVGTHANYAILQYRDNKPTSLASSRTLFSYGLKKTDLLEFQV
jgi:hypothetical protein